MKAVVEGRTVNLPDIHIIGAPKSGSSSLYAYLAQHTEIYVPEPIEGRTKEPRTLLYLNGMPPNPPSDLFVTDFDEYLSLYACAGEKKALEGSIVYMYYHEIVIPNLRKVYERPEDIWYIAILRDPTERAFSHYRARVFGKRESLPFREVVAPETIRKRLEAGGPADQDYIGQGMYYKQIKAFMDAFPKVRVYLLDDMKRDAQWVVNDICDFVEIERFTPSFERYNVTKKPIVRQGLFEVSKMQGPLSNRFPLITKIPLSWRVAPFKILERLSWKEIKRDEKAMAELRGIFREDILKLQELIDRDLSAWLK